MQCMYTAYIRWYTYISSYIGTIKRYYLIFYILIFRNTGICILYRSRKGTNRLKYVLSTFQIEDMKEKARVPVILSSCPSHWRIVLVPGVDPVSFQTFTDLPDPRGRTPQYRCRETLHFAFTIDVVELGTIEWIPVSGRNAWPHSILHKATYLTATSHVLGSKLWSLHLSFSC
jgi:hypothetical protein